MYKYSVLILLFSLILDFRSQAQLKLESLDLASEVSSWYDASIGKNNTGILLGEYQPVFRHSKNTHQFFSSDQWMFSTLSFRNQTYDSIALLYDLEEDVLVIRHPSDFRFHSQPIKLIQNQVSWFKLHDHLFKYYNKEDACPKPGFYDELFAGEYIKLFVKRSKHLEANQSPEYITADKYFFSVDGNYHKVAGKITFLRVLKAYKSLIRRYIITNKLKIKTQSEYESHMIGLTQYVNDLLSQKP